MEERSKTTTNPGLTSTLKEDLDRFISHRYVDITLIFLIILSVSLLVLERIHDADSRLGHIVDFFGDLLTCIFVVELSIRCYVAENKWQFFKSWWVDILAVLPLLRSLRFLRILRMLRILRVGMILNRRISSVSQTFRESFSEVTLVVVLLLAAVFLGAVGVHFAERNNPAFRELSSSFWWSFLSLMAGEPVEGMPRSVPGKLLLVGVMLCGMTIFALLIGVVSAGMATRLREQMKNQINEIRKQRNHVIICGVNRMLNRVIEEMQYMPEFQERGIVVISEADELPPLSKKIRYPSNVFFIQGDYTKLHVLYDAGLQYASIAILLADKTMQRPDQDRDARTVLAAMLIERQSKKWGREIFTCVELLNADNMEQLEAQGVEELVVLDDYGGSIIAASSSNQGMVKVFNELFTRGWGNTFIKEPISKFSYLIGKTVLEAISLLKTKDDAILLAVERRQESSPKVNPPADMVLDEGDLLVLIAPMSKRR